MVSVYFPGVGSRASGSCGILGDVVGGGIRLGAHDGAARRVEESGVTGDEIVLRRPRGSGLTASERGVFQRDLPGRARWP